MKRFGLCLLICVCFLTTSINVAAAPRNELGGIEICTEEEINRAMERLNSMSENTSTVKVNDKYLLSKTITETYTEKSLFRATYQKNVEIDYKLISIFGIEVGAATVYASFQYDHSTVTALSCSGIVSSTFPGITAESVSSGTSSGATTVSAWGEYKCRIVGGTEGIQLGSKEFLIQVKCTPSGTISDSVS